MRPLTIAACFICLTLVNFACKKDIYKITFRGKIFGIACSQVGIDVEGEPGTGGGLAWKDNSGVQHTNIINIGNYCYITDKSLYSGDEVTFRISKDNVAPGPPCNMLLCGANGPSNKVYVYDVEKVN